MMNLIKLELKKFKIESFISGIVICNIIIMSLLVIVFVATSMESDEFVTSFQESITLIDTMVRATIIIYSSIVLAKFTIEEYKNRTINIMFMYPIGRRKLFIAKLIIVMIFTFINIILSNIIAISIFSIVDQVINIVPGSFSIGAIINILPNLIIGSIFVCGMMLIPLYFGMRKKSVTATIVTGILLVSIVSSSGNGSFSIIQSIPIMSVIGVAGLLIGLSTFKNIESEDVL